MRLYLRMILGAYKPDGHFTDDEDNRLAAALVEIIKNVR